MDSARYLCNHGGPSSIEVEVVKGSAAAISKVAISNGHCILSFARQVQWILMVKLLKKPHHWIRPGQGSRSKGAEKCLPRF